MRPQSSGRLELILTVVSVALVAVVTVSGLAFSELMRQPVAAQKPGTPAAVQMRLVCPAPALAAEPVAAVEIPAKHAFMPDDYGVIRGFGEFCELYLRRGGEYVISEKWPGEGFTFVGRFEGRAQRDSTEQFVWHNEAKIGSRVRRQEYRCETPRTYRCEPPSAQHLTLEYRP
jgi:hypothetical protein